MKQEHFKIRRLTEPHKGEIAEVTVFPNGSYSVAGKDWGTAGPGPIDDLFKHKSFERLPEELDIFDCLADIKKEGSKVQASVSHVEHDRRVSGVHRPVVKPDVDNYVKATLDALNGIIWKDDAQIVTLHASKYYSDHPRIEMKVEVLK